jgi:EthD domain
MVLEAGYSGTTGFRKVVKVTVMVKKKVGLSDSAFIEHYNNQHAQMAAPVLLKHKIISYSLVGQFHISRATLSVLLRARTDMNFAHGQTFVSSDAYRKHLGSMSSTRTKRKN